MIQEAPCRQFPYRTEHVYQEAVGAFTFRVYVAAVSREFELFNEFDCWESLGFCENRSEALAAIREAGLNVEVDPVRDEDGSPTFGFRVSFFEKIVGLFILEPYASRFPRQSVFAGQMTQYLGERKRQYIEFCEEHGEKPWFEEP